MRHPERIEDYLRHISEAIDRATEYLRPLEDLEAFQGSRQVQDAVVRNIEIMGEAVNKTGNLIAVLGVEVFRILEDGLATETYSAIRSI